MTRPAYTTAVRNEIEADIRQAALSLVEKVGFRGTSLRAIAKELGWSATALYGYYENKDSLFEAIRADGFKQMRQLLSDVRNKSASATEAGAQAMYAYVKFSQDQRALYQLMYELDQGQIAERPIVYEERARAFAEAEGIAANILKETDLPYTDNELAHLLWTAAHGISALDVANQLDLGMTADELIEPLVQTMVRGLLRKED